MLQSSICGFLILKLTFDSLEFLSEFVVLALRRTQVTLCLLKRLTLQLQIFRGLLGGTLDPCKIPHRLPPGFKRASPVIVVRDSFFCLRRSGVFALRERHEHPEKHLCTGTLEL